MYNINMGRKKLAEEDKRKHIVININDSLIDKLRPLVREKNILRKVIGDDFISLLDRGLVLNPIKVNISH